MAFEVNKLKLRNMKNLIILALLLWIELNCFSQTKAVFPYDNPSKDILRELAFTPNAKGFAFRTSLIESINTGLADTTFKVSATRLDEIFNHLYLEEVYLEESGYKNSGWNSVSKKMVPSIGHKWSGFAWVFRIGSFAIIVIKGDCGNILAVPVTKIQNNTQYQTPKQNTENVNNNNYIPPENNPNSNSNNYQQKSCPRYFYPYQLESAEVYYERPPSGVIYGGNNYGGCNYGYSVGYSNGCNNYYGNNCNHHSGCNHSHGDGYSYSSGGSGNSSYYGHRR